MKAARFYEANKPLVIDDVEPTAPTGSGVLVRIVGSGVCHSDLHILDGEVPMLKSPITLGHENAGVVEAVGSEVEGLVVGDSVAVFGAWGCGHCGYCRRGEENLCNMLAWVGIGVDGGYAEYLHVPHDRHLVKLGAVDPVEAAPLVDAGLTPYRAIRRSLPYLRPGAAAVLIGVGGLGHLAVQIFKAVSPGAKIIAVDVSDDKLQLARDLGADHVVDGRGDAAAEIQMLTGGDGANAVIDLVGSDQSLKTAAGAAGRQSIIIVVGIAGGMLPVGFMGIPPECVVTNSLWGSRQELEELLALAEAGSVHPRIQRYPLEEINEVFAELKAGRIEGRAVITP